MSWVLASGDVLAHYCVLSPLGSGGTGQVYLAEDVRLGRRVALKVLSPGSMADEEGRRRFEREARTVSALNHPNILTVYDAGHADGMPFLATEYVDGVTLRSIVNRGGVGVRRALELAVQIAQALAAAHDAGVVHRDLKPENVMIRADGYVKVLDFGLAKLSNRDSFTGDGDAVTRLVDTRDGIVVGTVSYMAPEQARGQELDQRADLFAFGVLLYEMLAGRSPFEGATGADVISSILLHDPEPLPLPASVADDLNRVIARALRKDRGERYQSGAELLRDLRALVPALESNDTDRPVTAPGRSSDDGPGRAAVAATSKPRAPKKRRRVIGSLAVLPLVNRTADPELDYVSDGLTESLINNLSQLPRLRVMARSTVFRYKERQEDPRSVGRDLAVQAVLTGHVLQRGQDLIVGAELVDVDDGSQLWGTLLNRRPSDVFVLQAEISRELTTALRLRLTRDEKKRIGKRHTVSAEAYRLYLRGRYFANSRTGDGLRKARVLFERAIAEDPVYALAYAGLADCCSLMAVSFRARSGRQLIEHARAAAMKALGLDERLAEGHASLAFIKFRFDWDWPGAEAEFARALELNPGHAPSRQWHAMYLAARSRFEVALAEMKRALELDPLSMIIRTGLGRVLHFAGRRREAVAQFEHVLQVNPEFAQARIDLALTRMSLGELDAARDELDRAEEILGPVSTVVLLKACCALREGRADEGRPAFDSLRERYDSGAAGADDLALLAADIGDWPTALEWLTVACSQRAPFLGYVDVEPAMASLTRDPACRALLQRHGFAAGA